MTSNLPQDLETDHRDYRRVAHAIAFIEAAAPARPRLQDVAREMGLSAHHAQRLFSRWAGLSPKQFQSFVLHTQARRSLAEGASVLDAALDAGLSGPGRLHDLTVRVEGLSPGELKSSGAGVAVATGTHSSPFGAAVFAVGPRGLMGLAFADHGAEAAALKDLKDRWPGAKVSFDPSKTAPYAEQIFRARTGEVKVQLSGTPFQIKVWQALLRIPEGQLTSYRELAASLGHDRATRAVASAVGRNPVAFLIPCHRVLRKSGALGGYHWGLERKRVMLAWERAVSLSG